MTEDTEDIIFEDQVYFKDCDCHHYPEEHGWEQCNVEGCYCRGGWFK